MVVARYDEAMSSSVSGGKRETFIDGSRVAFFGGSFDPPHLGHLAVARAARTALHLDTVLFAPVGTQPLKPQGSTASYEDRLAMTRLAIADEPGFSISLADAPSPTGMPNYTIVTLLALRAELPPECALFCLMGADSFFGLRSWHRAAEVPFAAPLVVASRPAESRGGHIAALKAALPAGLTMEAALDEDSIVEGIEVRGFTVGNQAGDRAPLFLLPGLDVEISASEIRDQLHTSAGAAGLLPDAVADYVRTRALYR
jgi:nicotinate-nucleotide adenylyltransferase